MGEKKSFGKIMSSIWYFISCLAIICLIVIALGVLYQVLKKEFGRIDLLIWFFYGFAGFFVLFLIPKQRQNTKWLMTFMHEFIHMIFAILCFRKVHRFTVDGKDNHVVYDSGPIGYTLITLAPYFFPLLCFILLPWRYTTDNETFLNFIDILLGFTYAFHVCCWVKQIRLDQTDIIGPGTVKSMLIIIFFQILAFCILFSTPGSGVEVALWRVFSIYTTNTIGAIQVWASHLIALL